MENQDERVAEAESNTNIFSLPVESFILNMTSLAEYIRLKTAEAAARSSRRTDDDDVDKSLNELIKEKQLCNFTGGDLSSEKVIVYEHSLLRGGILSSGKLSTDSNREYTPDAYKSLDEVVAERGILKPPKYSSTSGQDDDGLPITGINSSKQRPPKKSVRIVVDDDVISNAVDPLTSTLENVIQSRRIDDEVKKGGRRKRSFEDMICTEQQDDGVIVSYELGDNFGQGPAKREHKWPKGLTPYRAVGFVTGKGFLIEFKIGKLKEEDEEEQELNRDHLWRCIISGGGVEGKADSSRKVVAREMASREFLKKLRVQHPDVVIPRFELQPEFLIDPKVGKWVEELAGEVGSEVEFSKTVKKLDPGRRQKGDPSYVFVSTYLIDGVPYQGVSTNDNYSALEAARKAWEMLTGEEFQHTKYFLGDRCDPLLQFDFIESEAYHVVSADVEREAIQATPTAEAVEQDLILDELENCISDDDTFPVHSFTSVLKRTPELNEMLKKTKQVKQLRKKKELDARRNLAVNINPLSHIPATTIGNSVVLPGMKLKDPLPLFVELYKKVVSESQKPSRGSGLAPSASTGVTPGLGRGRGMGRGRVMIEY